MQQLYCRRPYDRQISRLGVMIGGTKHVGIEAMQRH
jgi:hypothetical protein